MLVPHTRTQFLCDYYFMTISDIKYWRGSFISLHDPGYASVLFVSHLQSSVRPNPTKGDTAPFHIHVSLSFGVQLMILLAADCIHRLFAPFPLLGYLMDDYVRVQTLATSFIRRFDCFRTCSQLLTICSSRANYIRPCDNLTDRKSVV